MLLCDLGCVEGDCLLQHGAGQGKAGSTHVLGDRGAGKGLAGRGVGTDSRTDQGREPRGGPRGPAGQRAAEERSGQRAWRL